MKKFLFLFLIVTTISFPQYFGWENYGEMDNPVAGGDTYTNFGSIYIIGGYSDSLQAPVNWIQKYNINENNWSIDSMSIPRFGLVTEKYYDFAYFFGGINDESTSISGIEKWSESFTDEAVFAFDINFNRNFSTGHIIDDKFYIIGGNPLPGTSSERIPFIVEYDLTQNQVTFQTDSLFNSGDLPEQQMSEVVGNDIFIFGGVVNGISQDIYKFNIVDHSYQKLEIKLLEPRAGGRAILSVEKDKIFIIGGYNENLEALTSVEIFYVYGEQYYLEEGPYINVARYNFMSAEMDGRLYLFGGYDSEKNVVKTVEMLYEYAITDIDETSSDDIESEFELHQNYPNPFNPTTTIEYSVPINEKRETKNVQIIVYDLLGKEVVTLVNKSQNPGKYKIEFDASQYPSGVYYYQLKTNTFIQTKKMILLK